MNAGWLAARGLEPGDQLRPDSVIPQRPPLLLLDRVDGIRRGETPAVAASLAITGAEPVLAGHFPGRPVWPGSYTIEGLAQACALAGGLAPDADPLGAAERGTAHVALVAAVKVKLTGVVTPPARIEYFVELAHVVGGVARFAVEASVAGREVARGSIDVVWRDAQQRST